MKPDTLAIKGTISNGGQPGSALADLTGEQARAAYLTAVVQVLDEAVLVFDRDLRLVLWNPKAHVLAPLPRGDFAVGLSLFDFLMERAKAGMFGNGVPLRAVEERLRRLTMDGLPPPDAIVLADGRPGQLRWLVPPSGGLGLLLAPALPDPPQSKDTEPDTRFDAIGRMTAGIAHDMNNLLAIIIGNLELLNDGYDPAATRDLLETALDAANRSAEQAGRLLSFARDAPLAPSLIAPAKFLAGMERILDALLPASIALDLRVTAQLKEVWVDLAQLEAVIINLTVNARDAMSDGGTILIEAEETQVGRQDALYAGVAHGRYVCISCADTGEGMSQATLEQATEPFFTTKPPGHGTGLGLATADGFLRQSGGFMRIFSKLGQGTVVKIYLPVPEIEIST